MKLIPLLVLFSILASPLVYTTLKTYFYPFELLRDQRPGFESAILKNLEAYTRELKPFWDSDSFTLKDIVIASHLWGLFVVPEFRFPIEWYDYLMSVKKLCHFEYHAGYWRNS